MINNSGLKKLSKETPSTGSVSMALLIGFVIGICALFIAMFNLFQPDQLSLSDRYFPSPTATITPSITHTPTITSTPSLTSTPTITQTSTDTLTPTPNLSATQKAVNMIYASATSKAFILNTHNLVNEWNTVISDDFIDNKNQWQVGTNNNENGEITSEIRNGTYNWIVTTPHQAIQSIAINESPLTDFYLTVEAKLINGLTTDDYGIILREDTYGNYYYFGVNNSGEYAFFCFNKKQWISLINWTQTTSLVIAGINKLTVVGQDSQYTFFINDQYINNITDDKITQGTSSIAVRLSRSENKVRLGFDNIELRAP